MALASLLGECSTGLPVTVPGEEHCPFSGAGVPGSATPGPTLRVTYWCWREVFYPDRGEKRCHRREWAATFERRAVEASR